MGFFGGERLFSEGRISHWSKHVGIHFLIFHKNFKKLCMDIFLFSVHVFGIGELYKILT